jgi:hypothetical protein
MIQDAPLTQLAPIHQAMPLEMRESDLVEEDDPGFKLSLC